MKNKATSLTVRRGVASTSHLPPATSPIGPGGGVEPSRRIAAMNQWREQFNPLRGLDMVRAVSYLEAAQRGQVADYQWALSFIERRDADLLAIEDRRCGMLLQMDYDIKTLEQRYEQRGMGFDKTLAEDQTVALRQNYDAFANLYEAIEALVLAAVRGFAHVQYLAEGRLLNTLNLIDPWNVLRNGLHGDWYWNPDSKMTTATGLPPANRMDPAAYITRTTPRPIGEIAFLKYLRANLSMKDWDAFVEIYGIPGWVVIMPPGCPAGKEHEYQEAADNVAHGMSGSLPNGSDVKCADQPRGITPFQAHLDYWSQKLVLAGTSGMLTMLTAPGSGTLAGSAHWEAFQIIARAEARRISEIFQRTVDRFILNKEFNGKPALAYFSLAADEKQDPGTLLDHAVKVSQAGGQVDWSEFSERTGYTLTAAPPAPAPAFGQPPPPLRNRAVNSEQSTVNSELNAADAMLSALRSPLSIWLADVEAIMTNSTLNDVQVLDALEAKVRAMPRELLTKENIAAIAAPLESALGQAAAQAILEAGKVNSKQ